MSTLKLLNVPAMKILITLIESTAEPCAQITSFTRYMVFNFLSSSLILITTARFVNGKVKGIDEEFPHEGKALRPS